MALVRALSYWTFLLASPPRQGFRDATKTGASVGTPWVWTLGACWRCSSVTAAVINSIVEPVFSTRPFDFTLLLFGVGCLLISWLALEVNVRRRWPLTQERSEQVATPSLAIGYSPVKFGAAYLP